jgi:predicted nucleic-acid-binding Zn-ribbon protein
MKMTHRGCGGEVQESGNRPIYQSEEYGFVPAYECLKCNQEILGDSQIQLIPESDAEKIQIEALEYIHMGCCQEEFTIQTCLNCGEEIENLSFPIRLWNAYFLCETCGRMTRITALIVTIIMAFFGWFF